MRNHHIKLQIPLFVLPKVQFVVCLDTKCFLGQYDFESFFILQVMCNAKKNMEPQCIVSTVIISSAKFSDEK